MDGFNQAQDELYAFIDDTVRNEQPPANAQPQPSVEDDDELNEYLGGVEDDSQQEPAGYTPAESKQQEPVSAPSDRVIALERELAAVRERNSIYERALNAEIAREQQAQPQQPRGLYDESELNIDERYEQDYGDASPYMQAIVKRTLNDFYQKHYMPLVDELNQVRGRIQSQDQFNNNQQGQVFAMQLKSVVPDVEDIASSAEWQSFITQKAPYSGGRVTIADLVNGGIQSQNIGQVVEIIKDFKRQRGQTPTSQQRSPGRAQTTQPQTSGSSQKMLKMSDFERATANFQAGRLSYDKYQKIQDAFTQATIDGRVDYSK